MADQNNNDAMAQALAKLSDTLDRQTPISMPALADIPRFFSMPEGGEFLVNNRWVNSHGQPIKVSAEKEAYAEDLRKTSMRIRQEAFKDDEMVER